MAEAYRMAGLLSSAGRLRTGKATAAMTAVVTRFAPSPTGHLHLGHVRSAFEGWDCARRAGGRFLLRLEDIDRTRCREEYAAAILEDLAWVGLAWDGPVRRQSEHFADYQAALDRLGAMRLLYPCFCTRREIRAEIARAGAAPQGEAGAPYPGTCKRLAPAEQARRIASGADYGLRLDSEAASAVAGPLEWIEEGADGPVRCEAEPRHLGDVVLARKEFPASYHLAVTVDDAIQGVTLVTRGADLAIATHLHRLLQALLELPVPRYRHHPLVTDGAGKRLAKRDRAVSLRAMREAGMTPEQVLAAACGGPAVRPLSGPGTEMDAESTRR